MSNLVIASIVCVLYAVLAVYFWRAHVKGDGDLLSRGAIGHLVLLPLALHAYLLERGIFSAGDFDLGVINALSAIVWLTLLVYWVARFFYPIGGLQTIGPRQQNLDLLTVMIFPAASISKEKHILLTAILNQIEMLFILYRAGCIKPMHADKE